MSDLVYGANADTLGKTRGMSDLDGPPTPAAPVNPHAEIERVASGAIARQVRVVERSAGIVSLAAPSDTTKHGEMAIRRAVADHLKQAVVIFVLLDDSPAEP